MTEELDEIEQELNGQPWTLQETIYGLEYIAFSPPEKYGGFHQGAIDTAKAALYWLEQGRGIWAGS